MASVTKVRAKAPTIGPQMVPKPPPTSMLSTNATTLKSKISGDATRRKCA
jgi:hypothetical protein